jgi:hypothetical protein
MILTVSRICSWASTTTLKFFRAVLPTLARLQ